MPRHRLSCLRGHDIVVLAEERAGVDGGCEQPLHCIGAEHEHFCFGFGLRVEHRLLGCGAIGCVFSCENQVGLVVVDDGGVGFVGERFCGAYFLDTSSRVLVPLTLTSWKVWSVTRWLSSECDTVWKIVSVLVL
jgi:hypothetical protein